MSSRTPRPSSPAATRLVAMLPHDLLLLLRRWSWPVGWGLPIEEDRSVSLDDLKARVCAAIDARRDTIVGIAKEIATHPGDRLPRVQDGEARRQRVPRVRAGAARGAGGHRRPRRSPVQRGRPDRRDPRRARRARRRRTTRRRSGHGGGPRLRPQRPDRQHARARASGCSNRASSRSWPAGSSSSPSRPRSTSRSSTAST